MAARRSVVVAALAAVAAATATAFPGNAAGAVRQQGAFRFAGTNLGCERFVGAAEPFWVCFESNLTGAVPGSYGFEVSRSWQVLVRLRRLPAGAHRAIAARKPKHSHRPSAESSLKDLFSFSEPGATAPKPPLPVVPPIPRGATPMGQGPSTDPTSGVSFNLVPAGNGSPALLGAYVRDPQTGAATANGPISAVSSKDASESTFIQGQGEQTQVNKKQPPPTPHLDQADQLIFDAFLDEKAALGDIDIDHLAGKGARKLESSRQKLDSAQLELTAAAGAGEITSAEDRKLQDDMNEAVPDDSVAVRQLHIHAFSEARPVAVRLIKEALGEKDDAQRRIDAARARLVGGQ